MSVKCNKCDFKFTPGSVEELDRITKEHHEQHKKIKLIHQELTTLTQESQS